MKSKVTLYDTTLRDGTQAEEISFTVEDKLRIAEKLDGLGIHYIEAGWPGSNPRDLEFFKRCKKLKLKKAKIVAFGATRKSGNSASKDPNLRALLDSDTSVITLFGKSWDFHARDALRVSLSENLDLIGDSVAYLKKHVDEVIYDAEHFFDGYKANPEYALKSLKAAQEAGADWIVLCDTNGGSMPHEVERITGEVMKSVQTPLGIHCHNDGEVAVANSLAAVQAGARQIHGTINGIGERCGNANLISVIANLQIKLNIPVVTSEQLKRLREISHFVDELANKIPNTRQPYVGNSAFAHKGGVHVNAVLKNPKTYEHIDPEQVGNRRRVLVSDLSGASNVLYKAKEFNLNFNSKDPVVKRILNNLKELENQGFQFEGAEASFEILMKKALGKHRSFFKLISFRVTDEKLADRETPYSVATLQVEVDGQQQHMAAEGHGPINALDNALRKALERFYPQLKEVKLIDYKVRVLQSNQGTGSQVRVLIESSDGKEKWGTVGVSENIIQASWMALVDSIDYKLYKDFEKRHSKS
ncbi:MAG: citramalate synthase [bacterium]